MIDPLKTQILYHRVTVTREWKFYINTRIYTLYKGLETVATSTTKCWHSQPEYATVDSHSCSMSGLPPGTELRKHHALMKHTC